MGKLKSKNIIIIISLFNLKITFFSKTYSPFHQISKLFDSAWGSRFCSALWSITSRPYETSNLLKNHMKRFIKLHNVTKTQRLNFRSQKPILDQENRKDTNSNKTKFSIATK